VICRAVCLSVFVCVCVSCEDVYSLSRHRAKPPADRGGLHFSRAVVGSWVRAGCARSVFLPF